GADVEEGGGERRLGGDRRDRGAGDDGWQLGGAASGAVADAAGRAAGRRRRRHAGRPLGGLGRAKSGERDQGSGGAPRQARDSRRHSGSGQAVAAGAAGAGADRGPARDDGPDRSPGVALRALPARMRDERKPALLDEPDRLARRGGRDRRDGRRRRGADPAAVDPRPDQPDRLPGGPSLRPRQYLRLLLIQASAFADGRQGYMN